MKRIFIILLAVALPFFGCEDDKSDKKFMEFDEQVVIDYLAGTPRFSGWHELIQRAGMEATFRLSTTPMTCFVVSNDSLRSFVKRKYGVDNISDLPVETAQLLVKYHTLPNTVRNLSSFRNGKLADSTATGDYLSCLFTTEGGGGVYMNRESKIINYDKVMVNGVVHEISKVIDPVVSTLADYLTSNAGRFGIMKALYDACSEETRALFSQLQMDDVKAMKCRRTLFVVPDEVYAAAGINSLADLKSHLGIADSGLDEYLRYHMLEREFYSKDMIERLEHAPISKSGDGTSAVSHKLVDPLGVNLATMAENRLITVNSGEMNVMFNQSVGEVGFRGDNYNIPVKNGVIHELGGVLKMADPEPMISFIEPTDYITFERLSSFRAASVGKTQTLLVNEDMAPYATWEATPQGKSDALAYLVFTTGNYNFKDNGFLYGDCVLVRLGPVGYLEFTTPPIPKGSYFVKPFYKTIKNNGGKFRLLIDGKLVGSEFSCYTPGYDNFWISKLGIAGFADTRRHTIRIEAGSKAGELHLDMIIFEPIK